MSEAHVARHRAALARLSEPGGPLAPGSRKATVRNREWFDDDGDPLDERGRLHDRLMEQYLAAFPDVRREHKAVVLAGPPGAGKSSVLRQVLGDEVDSYLRVDPDEFKARLLEQALDDGSYESAIKPAEVKALEAEGEQFFPMDLATLVHEESSMLASNLRDDAMMRGDNLVIDGVLWDADKAVGLGRALAARGYQVEVIDVEVPYEVSLRSIEQRWAQEYVAAREGRSRLGGRDVPTPYVQGVFDGPEGRSKPEHAAERLAREVPEVHRFRRFSAPAADQPRTLDVDLHRSTPGGDLVPTPGGVRTSTSRVRHPHLAPRATRSRGD